MHEGLENEDCAGGLAPDLQHKMVCSRFSSQRYRLRLPPGSALRLMIVLSLAIWVGVISFLGWVLF
jgi:hypothetical protein